MPENTKIEALRVALIEGERSGASTSFDFGEFVNRKRQGEKPKMSTRKDDARWRRRCQ